jgi:ABC-type antimicrobial peptide transport system permease subunit
VRTLGEPPRSFLYRTYSQDYSSYMTLVVRTRGPADGALRAITGVLRGLDPGLILVQTRTMERHLATRLLPARLGAFVITCVSILALGLAIIGLYGVVSYAVARRTREVGIRMSLGADARGVVGLMMSGGMKLVFAGAAAGMALAFMGTRALRGLLFGVQALDPLTFIAVPVLLIAVAALAAWLPARQASRVDPVRALRS